MHTLVRSYFKYHDFAVYCAQAGRGYVKTRLSPAKFGRLPVVRGRVRFLIRGEAVFGDLLSISGDTADVRFVVAETGRLTVGDDVTINAGVIVEAWHDVRIGNRVMLAPHVTILDSNRHEVEPGAKLYKGPIVIGDNVWITEGVSVLSGVTIGSGSVIGAHSVVSRDIPPNSFAAGSPARVIRSLNVPDGWSRRWGYERNRPSPGLWAGVRRVFVGDPSEASQEDARQEDLAHREHEAVK